MKELHYQLANIKNILIKKSPFTDRYTKEVAKYNSFLFNPRLLSPIVVFGHDEKLFLSYVITCTR